MELFGLLERISNFMTIFGELLWLCDEFLFDCSGRFLINGGNGVQFELSTSAIGLKN